jgi:hypothetical protein
MDTKRRRGVIALFLILSIGTYFRVEGHDSIRLVLFLSILIMGLLAGILISDVAHLLRNKKGDKDKLV